MLQGSWLSGFSLQMCSVFDQTSHSMLRVFALQILLRVLTLMSVSCCRGAGSFPFLLSYWTLTQIVSTWISSLKNWCNSMGTRVRTRPWVSRCRADVAHMIEEVVHWSQGCLFDLHVEVFLSLKRIISCCQWSDSCVRPWMLSINKLPSMFNEL